MIKYLKNIFKTVQPKDGDIKIRPEMVQSADVQIDSQILNQASNTKQLIEDFSILNSIASLILIFDEQGKLTKVNDAALEFFEIEDKALVVGDSWLTKVHESDKITFYRDFMLHNSRMLPFKSVFRMISFSGERWFLAQFIPHFTNGSYLGFVATLTDITDQQIATEEISAQKKFINDVLDAVADPIFVKDANHKWRLGNTAFTALMGMPKEEYIGRTDYDIFPKEQADVFWQTDSAVMRSGDININEELINSGLGVLTISTKKAPIKFTDGSTGLVGIIRDITEIRKMQKELQKKS